MSARDVMDVATDIACGVGNQFGGHIYEGCDRDTIELGIRRLTAAGYRILGPEELDRETIERCASKAESWLTDWAYDLEDTRDGYIEARSSGVHAGRKIKPEMAKAFAQQFRQRSDAVAGCASPVAAALRTLQSQEAGNEGR